MTEVVDVLPAASHVAFSDETRFNVGRYRAIALVTVERGWLAAISAEVRRLLAEAGVAELKWQKLRTARDRFAALSIVDCAMRHVQAGGVRIDTLLWDVEDTRHKVAGRDDRQNLHRMYYHLFKNVLARRWPEGATWQLVPDEQASMDWSSIAGSLQDTRLAVERRTDLFGQQELGARLRTELGVAAITPAASHLEPLIQVADLFAGLGVYSREYFQKYEHWHANQGGQLSLFDAEPARLSSSDRERCFVLNELDRRCKKQRLGVSLKSHRRLATPDPARPLNFWWYEAQSGLDVAPVRKRRPML
ncbi:MAG: DUF3800 domain-containing protein [Anaerolineales bacterium]